MPIELKALQEASDDVKANRDAIAIRDCAKAFADKAIQDQKEAFRSWNIVADWKDGCYYSYDPQFEAEQLDLFLRMYQVGDFIDSFGDFFYVLQALMFCRFCTNF